MAWDSTNVNTGMISRDEAVQYAKELADNQGIRGLFKVSIKKDDGTITVIATPDDMPEQVKKDSIIVSAVLDQA